MVAEEPATQLFEQNNGISKNFATTFCLFSLQKDQKIRTYWNFKMAFCKKYLKNIFNSVRNQYIHLRNDGTHLFI